MQDMGIRAFVVKLSMDISSRPTYKEESPEAALAAAHNFCKQCREEVSQVEKHRRLVEPVLTPRFVPTCSNELLQGLGKLAAEQDLRIQSHMAESHDQVEWVRAERNAEYMDVFAQVVPHSLLRVPQSYSAYVLALIAQSLDPTNDPSALHVPLPSQSRKSGED